MYSYAHLFFLVGFLKGGRSEGLNHSCNGDATAPVPAVKRVSSESMFSLLDFSGDSEPLVASGAAADPFPPTSADKPVSDPFATTPASAAAPPCANASVLNLFGSDPFAVAADAKPAAEPFASVPTLKRASDPFGFGDQGASDYSENPSWAAFDFTVNSVPPEGYPGAFLANNVTTSIPTQVFEGAAWDTSSSAGNCGWSAFGLLTPAPPELVLGTTPAPLAASFGQVSCVLFLSFCVLIIVSCHLFRVICGASATFAIINLGDLTRPLFYCKWRGVQIVKI
jgi:hypothetical protein